MKKQLKTGEPKVCRLLGEVSFENIIENIEKPLRFFVSYCFIILTNSIIDRKIKTYRL